jgi:hypothetical protein
MEGGGDSREGKARLRQGMGGFLRSLRNAASKKRIHWKVVTCGSRNEAHDAFLDANEKSPETCNVLLVDSEGPAARPLRAHLQRRDGWKLSGVSEEVIHLMIQTMETWIVADSDAVAAYYQQHFLKSALPKSQNLEAVRKEQIYGSLRHATAQTQKKEYRKIRDAAALLERIDPAIVRSRCPSCDRLFVTLTRVIDSS